MSCFCRGSKSATAAPSPAPALRPKEEREENKQVEEPAEKTNSTLPAPLSSTHKQEETIKAQQKKEEILDTLSPSHSPSSSSSSKDLSSSHAESEKEKEASPAASPPLDPLLEKVIQHGEERVEFALSLLGSPHWEDLKTVSGVELRMIPAGALGEDAKQVVSGRMSFGEVGEFTHEEIISFVVDLSQKGKWDPQFGRGKVLKNFTSELPPALRSSSAGVEWVWSCMKKQIGLSPREFIYQAYFKRVDSFTSVLACGSNPNVREFSKDQVYADGMVRAQLELGGFVIRDEGGKTVVTYFNQVDVGGNLPVWLVNKVQQKQPTVLAGIHECMKKNKK